MTATDTDARQVELDPAWTYGTATARILHGGYLLELVAGAAVTGAHPHPLATTAHFLRAPAAGPATLEVTPLRAGRAAATTRVALVQDGRVALDVTVTSGRLPEQPSTPLWIDTSPPALPPLAECERTRVDGNGITDNVDLRYPRGGGWVESGRAEVSAWIRFADERPVTPLGLLCLADALPPVTFPLGLQGWVPTVEMTVHPRALPADGWLRATQRARVIADGWLDEECEIWDAEDRLVCQARQLAMFRAA